MMQDLRHQHEAEGVSFGRSIHVDAPMSSLTSRVRLGSCFKNGQKLFVPALVTSQLHNSRSQAQKKEDGWR